MKKVIFTLFFSIWFAALAVIAVIIALIRSILPKYRVLLLLVVPFIAFTQSTDIPGENVVEPKLGRVNRVFDADTLYGFALVLYLKPPTIDDRKDNPEYEARPVPAYCLRFASKDAEFYYPNGVKINPADVFLFKIRYIPNK